MSTSEATFVDENKNVAFKTILQMKILNELFLVTRAHNYKDFIYSKNNITLIKPSQI